jgi:hypothetical protein
VGNGSRYFQIVQEFAKAIAAQSGQTLVRQPGPRAGWKAQGVDGVPDITIHWKREGLSMLDAPPRIVCVAQGGDFGVVDQPGGGRRVDSVPLAPTRAKTILVRRFSLQCYAWGQDDEQSEDLYYNALRAFHHLFSDAEQPGKAPVFTNEVWEEEQPGAGGQSTFGAMISFFAMFEIVVQDKPDQLVVVKQVTNQLTFKNPAEAQYVTVPR